MTNREKILDGITVLNLSTFVTGGFCTTMLANQGADVVKTEQPGYGDAVRHTGPPFVHGESPYYWTVNYGKESVELDLKKPEAREALYDLVEATDVFVQNYRPGTPERLDVDYDSNADAEDVPFGSAESGWPPCPPGVAMFAPDRLPGGVRYDVEYS